MDLYYVSWIVLELILNKNYSIDIADDNKIFELCNTSNSYLTIKEMKEKVMKDHLKIYN